MANLKAQYETAQTLLWAMKEELQGNEFDDETFSRKAGEFAKQNAHVDNLRAAWLKSCNTIAAIKMERESARIRSGYSIQDDFAYDVRLDAARKGVAA